MKEKELLKLKEKVDNAEQAVQQLKGRKKELLAQLKKDFNCNTIKEAKAKKKELSSEHEKTQEKLNAKLKEIKNKYDGGTE